MRPIFAIFCRKYIVVFDNRSRRARVDQNNKNFVFWMKLLFGVYYTLFTPKKLVRFCLWAFQENSHENNIRKFLIEETSSGAKMIINRGEGLVPHWGSSDTVQDNYPILKIWHWNNENVTLFYCKCGALGFKNENLIMLYCLIKTLSTNLNCAFRKSYVVTTYKHQLQHTNSRTSR